MSAVTCPNCGNLVDADARFCKFCAHSLIQTHEQTPQSDDTANAGTPVNSTTLLILGGIAVCLIIAVVVSIYIYRKSGTKPVDISVSSTPTPAPTMGERAKQIEDKIVKGEAISDNDISGLGSVDIVSAAKSAR
jgi:hypothetical protein